MRIARPLVDGATAQQIKELARDGFATVLEIADPPRELSIYRAGSIVIVDEFSVRASNVQAQGFGDDGATRTSVAGTLRRFIPLMPDGSPDVTATRLKPGDRFMLPESGPCIVQSIRPDRFGIESAEYMLETGSA